MIEQDSRFLGVEDSKERLRVIKSHLLLCILMV
jgi:hypothetical protein